MKTVGSYELKTHLARFLALVMRGEVIRVTKHGQAIARIIPESNGRGKRFSKKQAIEELKNIQRVPLQGLKIRDLIEEGRNRRIKKYGI